MSKLMTAVALAAPSLFLAGLAQAQDYGYYDGWRAGIGVEDRRVKAASGALGLVGATSASKDSAAAKLSLGYDTSLGHGAWVIGGEGAASLGDGSFTVNGTNGQMRVKPGVNWQLSGRLGYRFTPQTLGYVRGGYEWQDVKRTVNFTGGGSAASSNPASGALVGVGLEQAMSPRMGLRLEYDQADLSHGLRDQEFGLSAHWKF